MSMDRTVIEGALRRLGEKAAAAGLRVEMTLYGGVVMMFAYDARPATKDVDAVFRPREEVLALAAAVAAERGLAEGWQNDDGRQFLGNIEAKLPWTELDLPGLVRSRPTARYLLALKARAARMPVPGSGGDSDDLVFLLRHTGQRTVEEVEATLERYFPGDALPDRNREVVVRALEAAHGGRGGN